LEAQSNATETPYFLKFVF